MGIDWDLSRKDISVSVGKQLVRIQPSPLGERRQLKPKTTWECSLNRCKNCKDCWNCRDCKDCWNCKDCRDCKDCKNCKDCWNCRNCKDCWNCWNCKDCRNCKLQDNKRYMILDVQFTKEEYEAWKKN